MPKPNPARELAPVSFSPNHEAVLRRILPAFAALGLLAPALLARADQTSLPECLSMEKVVTFSGAGYRHAASFTSTCDRDAACVVSSNSNPEAQSLTVPAGQQRSVVFHTSSPARGLEVRARCTLEGS